MRSRRTRVATAIAVAAGIALSLWLTTAGPSLAQSTGFVAEPEPLPLVTEFMPFSPGAALFDIWAIGNYVMQLTIVQAINAQLEEAQQRAVLTSTLTVARRYIQGGVERLDAILAPMPPGFVDNHRFGEPWGSGKLQRDLEAWEEKYPRFRFNTAGQCLRRPVRGLSPEEEVVFCDHYAFVMEELVRKWESRIRPCVNHLLTEWDRVHRAVNVPEKNVPLVALQTTIRNTLIGATDPSMPLELRGESADPGDPRALSAVISRARPSEVLEACQQRGPLSMMSLLASALEYDAGYASLQGKTSNTNLRVEIENLAQRMSFEVYVKKADEAQLSTEAKGIMIHPATIAPEDQIEPRGLRPDGTPGRAWVTAAPGDEIWIRAMTNGPQRDFVKHRMINRNVANPDAPWEEQTLLESNIVLMPDTLPRNFYALKYRTKPPNPLFSDWSVEGETYEWSNESGPWHVVGEAERLTSMPGMRDRLFGGASVTNDVIKIVLPDLEAANRLAELAIEAAGTTRWLREGPRTTLSADRREHRQEEEGGGRLAIRIRSW